MGLAARPEGMKSRSLVMLRVTLGRQFRGSVGEASAWSLRIRRNDKER
jgi:hypothetical protein